jgi:hypothetical protein
LTMEQLRMPELEDSERPTQGRTWLSGLRNV